MNFIETKKQEIENLYDDIKVYEEIHYGFKKIHIENLINPFIKKWCGNMSGHLLDTDENDGQRLRAEVFVDELKVKLQTKIQECESWCEYEIEFLDNYVEKNIAVKCCNCEKCINQREECNLKDRISELKQFIKWLGEIKC